MHTFFPHPPLEVMFFSPFGLYVRERAGNAFQLPSAQEKPVRGQGSPEEGSRHISIFISFSGTFADLSLVSLLHRARHGSLVLASCLLTTLAAVMVVCGKLSAAFFLSVCVCVCVCVCHVRLARALRDGVDQKESGARGGRGRLGPTL